MLTIQQKAQCVLWYHKLKSPTHINSIKRWFKNFMETGSILDRKRSGRPSIDEETVDAVCVAFHRSLRKSIRVALNELAIPHQMNSKNCASKNSKYRNDMYVRYKTCLYRYLQSTLKHINRITDKLVCLNTFLLKPFSYGRSIT